MIVGDELLGRVIDPLGNPLDGKGAINATETRLLETTGPIGGRTPTGARAAPDRHQGDRRHDPIGRGQRELIIGDRQTGKTALAVDTIINQKQFWGTDQAVRCIYVAIGQKASTVAEVVDLAGEGGGLGVHGGSAPPPRHRPRCRYALCRLSHRAALDVQGPARPDHLRRPVQTGRRLLQIAPLLRRPPGREAYPGDVFYLHSRLLERCAKLSDENGGGSLTGLPIVETKANDISAYIPTNVISITDGQIFLETDLFYLGPSRHQRRHLGVSGGGFWRRSGRCGGPPAPSDQPRPVPRAEAFAQFGSELDATSQAQLERGRRVVEVLKQPQFQPVPVEEQVLAIFAVTNGLMDSVPVRDIRRFETEMREYVRIGTGSDRLHGGDGRLPQGRRGGARHLRAGGGDQEFLEMFEPTE